MTTRPPELSWLRRNGQTHPLALLLPMSTGDKIKAETRSILRVPCTLIFPVTTLIKCKLGGALGHEELFEQGLYHFPHGVGAADVKRVHAAAVAGSGPSGARRRLRGLAEFHLHLDEASVSPVRILKREEKRTLSCTDGGT